MNATDEITGKMIFAFLRKMRRPFKTYDRSQSVLAHRYFLGFGMLITGIIGCYTNVLSLFTFARITRKPGASLKSYFQLIVICLVNICYLISSMLEFCPKGFKFKFSGPEFGEYEWLSDLGEITYKWVGPFKKMFTGMSAWMILIVGISRYLIIKDNKPEMSLLKQALIDTVLFLFTGGSYVIVFFRVEVSEFVYGSLKLTQTCKGAIYGIMFVEYLQFYILPMIFVALPWLIMVVFNIILFHFLIKADKRRKTLTSQKVENNNIMKILSIFGLTTTFLVGNIPYFIASAMVSLQSNFKDLKCYKKILVDDDYYPPQMTNFFINFSFTGALVQTISAGLTPLMYIVFGKKLRGIIFEIGCCRNVALPVENSVATVSSRLKTTTEITS